MQSIRVSAGIAQPLATRGPWLSRLQWAVPGALALVTMVSVVKVVVSFKFTNIKLLG